MNRYLRLGTVRRFYPSGEFDELRLSAGLNVLVGAKDTGKTSWLQTIALLLGDSRAAEIVLGPVLAAVFVRATAEVYFGQGPPRTLERRWHEHGSRQLMFVDDVAIDHAAFSDWIQEQLGIMPLVYPRGSVSESTRWSELPWGALWRLIHRSETDWNDLAPGQSERETHACILQFLGVAQLAFPAIAAKSAELKDEIGSAGDSRAQLDAIIEECAEGLLDLSAGALTSKDVEQAIAGMRTEVTSLESERQRELAAVDSQPTVAVELADRRAATLVELQKLSQADAETTRRLEDLLEYSQATALESTRLRRAEFASEILRPITVTKCPYCDQRVAVERMDTAHCYVCTQSLPHKAHAWAAVRQRIKFEQQQVEGESEELASMLTRASEEQSQIRRDIARMRASLQQTEVELRAAQDGLRRGLPPGVLSATTRLGILSQKLNQLERLRTLVERRDFLEGTLRRLHLQQAELLASADSSEVDYEALSRELTTGLGEYVEAIREVNPQRWIHERLHVVLDGSVFRLRVGSGSWRGVGATSGAIVIIALQYALLRLTCRDGFKYPGLLLLDFPITLSDGMSVSGHENYLLQPFARLVRGAPLQVVVAGRSFRSLAGASRILLRKDWAQGGSFSPSAQLDLPLESSALSPTPDAQSMLLRLAVHFHSNGRQIMFVMDRATVRELTQLIPELRSSVESGRSWPGRNAVVRWHDGSFKTKLVHNKDNGNVKVTVRKTDAPLLWAYLDHFLRYNHGRHSFVARYTLGQGGALDELFVDVRSAAADTES